MEVDWLLPTVTSVLRLLIISLLFIGNWCAVFMVLAYPKNKREFRRTLTLTILCVNLVYLLMIWIPFTLTSLRHDLFTTPAAGHVDEEDTKAGGATTKDLLDIPEALTSDMAAEFVVEYIDLRGQQNVIQETWLPILQRKVIKQQRLTGPGKLVDVVDSPSTRRQHMVNHSTVVANHSIDPDIDIFLRWNSFIQDIQTSACVYTLTLAAIVGMFICRKDIAARCERLSVSPCAVTLVLVPLLFSLGLRYSTTTTLQHTHHSHNKISVHAGYSLYSLICDVHVTREYVVVMLIECGVVLMAAGLMLAGFRVLVATRHDATQLDEEDDEPCPHASVLSSIEECAVDWMLLLGCFWAWAKPLMILTMFLVYGPHWSSCVSWLSNVVASVPMVFIPLAVFMSRPPNTIAKSRCFPSLESNEDHHHHQSDYCTCCDHEKCTQLAYPSVQPSQQEDKNTSNHIITNTGDAAKHNTNKTASHAITSETAKLHTNTNSETLVQPLSGGLGASDSNDSLLAKSSSAPPPPPVKATSGDKSRVRENLKFYLGTDILNHTKKSSSSEQEDTCIILDNEWPSPDTGDNNYNNGESKA